MRGLKRSISVLSVPELISSKKYLNGVLLCDRQCISGEGKSAPCRGGAPTWFEFDKFKTAVGCFIGKGESKIKTDILEVLTASCSLLRLYDPPKNLSEFSFSTCALYGSITFNFGHFPIYLPTIIYLT